MNQNQKPKQKPTREQIDSAIDKYSQRFYTLREIASQYCIDQEELIEMLCLAVIAKQHALLFGPWGCNKTRTINTFSHLCGARNGDLFRCTLDKTTPPEALLGPISPKILLEEDRFKRNLEGTVCTSFFAFIGECFSGNSATRRALHTVLNERYIENGGEYIEIPLHTAFLDSNDLSTRREDRPFFDRVGLRLEVNYLDPANKELFIAMRTSPRFNPARVAPLFTLKEIQTVSKLAQYVDVPPVIDDAMHLLRSDLFTRNIRLSDRRWYNAYGVLRASAVLYGRSAVSPSDMWALRYVLSDYIDGSANVVREALKPYQGQSIRDAEAAYVTDAEQSLQQAMQGNDDMKRSCLASVVSLEKNAYDSDTRDTLSGIAKKIQALLGAAPMSGDEDISEADADLELERLLGGALGDEESAQVEDEVPF